MSEVELLNAWRKDLASSVVDDETDNVYATYEYEYGREDLASLVVDDETDNVYAPYEYEYGNVIDNGIVYGESGYDEYAVSEETMTMKGSESERFYGVRNGIGMERSGFDQFFDSEEMMMNESESESLKDQVNGFLKAWGEMAVEFGKGCRDVLVQQNILSDDSFVVEKIGAPCAKVSARLRVLNELLPEDRDPAHTWPVVFFVFILAFSVLNINTKYSVTVPAAKTVHVRPCSATRILLPDGRHIAYHELGVTSDRARFSLMAPHSFLSSRLSGIPGVKASLLEEFGVRLVTYDLPGFGESDPHPQRNLNSSALDMLDLAEAVGVKDMFWVLGYSSASIHAWAALRYIPKKIAGAAMFAPLVNPYEPTMSKEESSITWGSWVSRRKLMYVLARRFPKLLSYFYHRTFLSGKYGQIDKWLSLSLGEKDRNLIKEPIFEDFWHRDVEESIRQGSAKPFMEEAVLQVSDWGFKLADLQVHRKCETKGFFRWLWSIYDQADCELSGFLGPIHIWQGMDDMVVPPSMTNYVGRVLPNSNLHKLANEGHFSGFFFCDECHRQIFYSLFGTPQGPLPIVDMDQSSSEGQTEEGFSTSNSTTE